MSEGSRGSLAGRGIVITRPARQAQTLACRVRELQGRPIVFPVIEIQDLGDPAMLHALVDRLDEFDIAIFVSPNAAAQGWKAIHARRGLPRRLKLAGIGRGTARALQALGASEVFAPSAGADSESLLALPEFKDVAGRRIVIFRGIGGRELIRDALEARGAHVEYAECYRRTRTSADPAPLLAAWGAGDIDAAVVTSSEGLRNFLDVLGRRGAGHLQRTPLFVPHPRIAETARSMGLTAIVVTGPGDDGLIAGLTTHLSR